MVFSDGVKRFRYAYGASPAAPAGCARGFGVAAWALSRVLGVLRRPGRSCIWFAGAIVLHDLVFLPLYSLLGLAAPARWSGRRAPSRLRIAALNHLRVPALLSGLMLLVWFPLVLRKAPSTLRARHRAVARRLPGPLAGAHRRAVRGLGAAVRRARLPRLARAMRRSMDRRATARGSVLVVDDEPTITEVVSRYLSGPATTTRVAGDGPSALALAGGERPDLVVLDLMLPGMDGLEVMRRLREPTAGGSRVSVILLTAQGRAHRSRDRPAPGRRRLRGQAVLARPSWWPAWTPCCAAWTPEPEREEPIAFDGLELDPVARRVTVRGEEAQLTVREYELLLHLVRHPGQAFSRDQLMDAVWQYSFYTDTSTVTVHVRRLRAKIEDDPSEPRWLQTVWGVGYRFQP